MLRSVAEYTDQQLKCLHFYYIHFAN